MTETQPTNENSVAYKSDNILDLKLPLIPNSNNKELIIVHIFDAPKELLFKAFTKAEHLKNWWGPRIVTNSFCEVDPRIGGKISILMIHPDGASFLLEGKFYEIIENEKLVFTTTGFKDKFGIPDFEFLNTVTFTEYKGKTKLTLNVQIVKITGEKARPAIKGMTDGWSQGFEKLEIYIEKQFSD